MDPEQIERAISFIVDQQAKFASGMEEFRQETKANFARLADVQAATLTYISSVAQSVDQLTKRVDTLAESVQRLEEMQAHTDERLNILVTVVDEIVRGRHA